LPYALFFAPLSDYTILWGIVTRNIGKKKQNICVICLNYTKGMTYVINRKLVENYDLVRYKWGMIYFETKAISSHGLF
jgi:hypothetical protein